MGKILAFIFGAAAGSLVTWKLVDAKYKNLADEEIESVREYYRNKKAKEKEKENEQESDKEEECIEVTPADKKEYAIKVQKLGYSNDDYAINEVDDSRLDYEDNNFGPVIIEPEEYGLEEEYETKSWIYYADGILADEDDEVITYHEDDIGEALADFDDYYESIYVKNDDKKCYYEILRSERKYEEIQNVSKEDKL